MTRGLEGVEGRLEGNRMRRSKKIVVRDRPSDQRSDEEITFYRPNRSIQRAAVAVTEEECPRGAVVTD